MQVQAAAAAVWQAQLPLPLRVDMCRCAQTRVHTRTCARTHEPVSWCTGSAAAGWYAGGADGGAGMAAIGIADCAAETGTAIAATGTSASSVKKKTVVGRWD